MKLDHLPLFCFLLKKHRVGVKQEDLVFRLLSTLFLYSRVTSGPGGVFTLPSQPSTTSSVSYMYASLLSASALKTAGKFLSPSRYSSTVSYSPAICSTTAGVSCPSSVMSYSARFAIELSSKISFSCLFCSSVSSVWKKWRVISSAASCLQVPEMSEGGGGGMWSSTSTGCTTRTGDSARTYRTTSTGECGSRLQIISGPYEDHFQIYIP